MRARILDLTSTVRASYWFFPALMMVGAVALSWLTVYIDTQVDFDEVSLSLIYLTQPAGAQTVLATIAGSVLSVAGLTFSIVMVVLTMASAQYGPRLLENFMRDRANQIVLALFISTFLYCLLVLRVVRGEGGVIDSVFVPQISLNLAILLAIVNLGAFVFFIHHTTSSIQAATIIARISDNLRRMILAGFPEQPLFPDSLGVGPDEAGVTPELPARSSDEWAPVFASRGGYLRALDEDGLMRAAVELDLVLVLRASPGSYVMRGEPLVRAHPGARLAGNEARIEGQFALGGSRTQAQDFTFLFDQLLEMALRALSPGVNDPITAIMCIDRMADNLNLLANRKVPSPYRFEEGTLRIVVPTPRVSNLLAHLFGPLRSFGKADYLTLNHLLDVLQRLQESTTDPRFRTSLRTEVKRVLDDARSGLSELDYERLVAANPEAAG